MGRIKNGTYKRLCTLFYFIIIYYTHTHIHYLHGIHIIIVMILLKLCSCKFHERTHCELFNKHGKN